MKKIVMAIVLVICLCCMAACDASAGMLQPTDGDAPVSGNVLSVYDAEMNPVGKFTYAKATENTIDVAQFAKTGYKFEGIFDMVSGVMLFNANGYQAPTVMLDADYNGVLKYSPLTYQFCFEAQEGRLENTADYMRSISYGEALGLFPMATLEGKDFDGWFDASGNRLSFGVTPVQTKLTGEGFDLSGETVKLYARYATKYCKVRLMFQDGTTDVQLQVEYGQKLPELSDYYKDDGSRIVRGFGVSAGATVPYDAPVYTDLELYAMWQDYKTVNMVYTSSDIRPIRIYRDGNLAVLPEGERMGYVFEGWYASALLSGNKLTEVPFGSLADAYYAKWSVGSYTIQFVADGKVISSSRFSIEEADVFVPPVPVKEHYTGRWEAYHLEYKDMVVNAIYEPEKLQVTLVSGVDYSYQDIPYGEMYTLPTPTKKGYEFVGWYYKDEAITGSDGKSLRPYTFDTGVTLTAQWQGIVCQLFFETNGGSAVETVSVEYGKPYRLTQVPERSGFYFGGWFDETMVNEYVDTITVTKDTVVYAKWIKSTAIYDVDGLKAMLNNPYGNYHLMANINLKGEEWVPLTQFNGILNGNGYKIYNFTLRQNGVDLGFVITNNGTIKNVTFSNVELANSVDGNISCAMGVVCAYNTGKLVGVNVERVTMLVNITGTNANNTIRVGAVVGENSGLLTNCSAESVLTYKANVRSSYVTGTSTTYVYIGGVVGKDSGIISHITGVLSVDVNEYVYAYCDSTSTNNCSTKNMFLQIGGIVGAEYGTLTDGNATIHCTMVSDAGGSNVNWYGRWAPSRYTNIGGVVGCAYENSTISQCVADGTMEMKRVGTQAESYEFALGGIIGKVDSGTVDNCASTVTMTIKEGFGGTMGGIAGLIKLNGKVSNVAYYGQIVTESFSGGWFGGLAGSVEGVLTKGYFHGKILSDSTQKADIAANISTTGSASKVIGNGNTRLIYGANSGSVSYAYIIDLDYGSELLQNAKLLFEDLCLFETDIWAVDDETGLYLIAFPENTLGGEEK